MTDDERRCLACQVGDHDRCYERYYGTENVCDCACIDQRYEDAITLQYEEYMEAAAWRPE